MIVLSIACFSLQAASRPARRAGSCSSCCSFFWWYTAANSELIWLYRADVCVLPIHACAAELVSWHRLECTALDIPAPGEITAVDHSQHGNNMHGVAINWDTVLQQHSAGSLALQPKADDIRHTL
eukprot:GHRR01030771.1.p1 GENE.GHRR01030771.1~~GHRR01030771.1.p1  ORF type:complete len:125 (-),score=36.06 GHRR01030771.1:504-878(-)